MHTLSRIALPGTDLELSSLGLGADVFGTKIRGEESRRLCEDFLEAGGNFFDTAHVYAFWIRGGLGASERELGACLHDLGCRDRVVIATKGGHPDAGRDYRRPDRYLSERVIGSDIAESLARLGTDQIDLYFLHRDDPRVPVGEIVEMMNREIHAARIRHFGVSNWSTQRIAAAHAYARENELRGIVASQAQWSLAAPSWPIGPDPVMRFVDDEDAAWYASAGLPVAAYSSTANGYFAGRGRESGTYASPANAARYARAVELAERLGRTPTQVALAYLRHQPATVIPLVGTTNREHLREAIDADAIELTPEDVRYLREG